MTESGNVPIVYGEVISGKSTETESMQQLLYYQISSQRPYKIQGNETFLLGFVISSNVAIMQVIQIAGWLSSDRVFSFECYQYKRGPDTSVETFLDGFLNLVVKEMFSGLSTIVLPPGIINNWPIQTILFSSRIASLPLYTSLGHKQACNVLHCRLDEFRNALPKENDTIFISKSYEELDPSTSIVVKACGNILFYYIILFLFRE